LRRSALRVRQSKKGLIPITLRAPQCDIFFADKAQRSEFVNSLTETMLY